MDSTRDPPRISRCSLNHVTPLFRRFVRDWPSWRYLDVLAWALPGLGRCAVASELISDGGFENVNYGVMNGFPYHGVIGDGWTVTEGGVNIYQGNQTTNYLYYAHSGSQFAYLGDINFNGTQKSSDQLNALNQTVQRPRAGDRHLYSLSFYASGFSAPREFRG